MKKEIDAEEMIKRLGLEKKPKLNLYGVMCSNFNKTWCIWSSVWGVIGVIYWLNKLINYCA